jgi:hypothetical protein
MTELLALPITQTLEYQMVDEPMPTLRLPLASNTMYQWNVRAITAQGLDIGAAFGENVVAG